MVLQRVRSAAAAEEIAQDVFVRVYEKLQQLKEVTRCAGWLRTIALQRCRLWLRAQRRRSKTCALSTTELAEDAAAKEGHSRILDGFFCIDDLISALPRGLRAAAVLCLVDELSPSAASAVLGIKPAALRKRLHDARAKLQRLIVERAEQQLLLHMLPPDFAQKCVCRCARAQQAKAGKEVMAMARKRSCDCGCRGASKRKPRPAAKPKPRQIR